MAWVSDLPIASTAVRPSINLQASNGVVLKLLGVLDDLGARHILASPQSVLLLRKLLDDEGRSHVILLDVSHLELQNGTRASTLTAARPVSCNWLPSNCHRQTDRQTEKRTA